MQGAITPMHDTQVSLPPVVKTTEREVKASRIIKVAKGYDTPPLGDSELAKLLLDSEQEMPLEYQKLAGQILAFVYALDRTRQLNRVKSER